ncbi:MAG: cytochrome P450 [Proteobacteria bacterium]|nr:cytochrome P450 [Pseudomonadota bacterium]
MSSTDAASLPAGPTTSPVVAMARWLFTPLAMLDGLSKQYGNVFTLRLPRLPEPFVFFAEPEAVRALWHGDPDVLRAGEANELLRSVVGAHSLLVLDGDAHLRERRLMLPPFHGDRMRAYGAAMRDATLRELARWPQGRAFPIHGAMQAITLDVILRTIFGVGAEAAQLAPLREALVRYTTLGTSWLGTALLLLVPPAQASRIQRAATGPFGALLPWAHISRAQQDTDRLVRALIADRRRAGTAGRDDVLSMLLDARDDHGAPMTDDELRDEMLTLLLAGHETTATALAWAIHHLLANPTWLARLRAELAEVVDADGHVPLDRLDRLVLLDAAIKETLRLTPIIPLVGRRLARPTTIAGHALPTGTTVMASIYLVHRRADLWPDPTRFDPGRFVGKKPDPTHFFPFGGGTRRCLGMAFALYEMKIVLATILATVDLAPAPGRPVRVVRRGITFAPSGGMPVVATTRSVPR